jgi:hypothetical protein
LSHGTDGDHEKFFSDNNNNNININNINGTIFGGKKVPEYKTRVLIFSTTFV